MKHNPRILRPAAHEIEAVRLRTDKARLAKLGDHSGSLEDRAARLSHEQWAQQLPRPSVKEERDFFDRTENKAHNVVMTAALGILEEYRDAKESRGAQPHHVIAALQLTESVTVERDALLAEFGHLPPRKDAK